MCIYQSGVCLERESQSSQTEKISKSIFFGCTRKQKNREREEEEEILAATPKQKPKAKKIRVRFVFEGHPLFSFPKQKKKPRFRCNTLYHFPRTKNVHYYK